MKPPSEIKIPQSIPAAQARSSASSESKIVLDANHSKRAFNMWVIDDSNRTIGGSRNSGLSHFATQLRTSVQSCSRLETVQAKNSVSTHHQNESSRNDHQTIMFCASYECHYVPSRACEKKGGTADQLSADNRAVDEKCGSGPFFAPSNLTCRDPQIQRLIDDCPSFDLGF